MLQFIKLFCNIDFNWFSYPLLRANKSIQDLTRERTLIWIYHTSARAKSIFRGNRGHGMYRSSLFPKIARALICTQQWIRKPAKTNIREQLDELEQLDSGTTLTFGICFLYFMVHKFFFYVECLVCYSLFFSMFLAIFELVDKDYRVRGCY